MAVTNGKRSPIRMQEQGQASGFRLLAPRKTNPNSKTSAPHLLRDEIGGRK